MPQNSTCRLWNLLLVFRVRGLYKGHTLKKGWHILCLLFCFAFNYLIAKELKINNVRFAWMCKKNKLKTLVVTFTYFSSFPPIWFFISQAIFAVSSHLDLMLGIPLKSDERYVKKERNIRTRVSSNSKIENRFKTISQSSINRFFLPPSLLFTILCCHSSSQTFSICGEGMNFFSCVRTFK